MTDAPTTQKKYPTMPEDIESEQKIVDEIKNQSPLSLKLKLFGINHNLLQIKDFEAQQQNEITILDMKTRKECQPDVERLNELINGAQIKEEELTNLSEYFTEEELAKKDELLAGVKPIEDYWLKCIQNHGALNEAISDNENDAVALKSLQKVEYICGEDAERPADFSLKFYFAENEFFTNDVLTVKLILKEPREPSKIEGTEINWKEGKCLTKKTVSKKQRNKKTGAQRTVTKTEDCNSLFKIFDTLEMPEGKDEDMDEEEQALQGDVYSHCDWAYAFFDELIPFSMEYYLGVKKDEYGEDDEDFEDEDDLGDDEDDDEDDAPKAKGKKAKAKGGAAKGGDDPKKECKQQ
mmetsp:Transcript_26204/g.23064  ORF Transcript_26204/g.23064 Transcript_26204/m.23064 type:complete len:351 (+) Transcript_26204:63-1115(+)